MGLNEGVVNPNAKLDEKGIVLSASFDVEAGTANVSYSHKVVNETTNTVIDEAVTKEITLTGEFAQAANDGLLAQVNAQLAANVPVATPAVSDAPTTESTEATAPVSESPATPPTTTTEAAPLDNVDSTGTIAPTTESAPEVAPAQ